MRLSSRLRRLWQEVKAEALALLDRPRKVSVSVPPSGDHVVLWVEHGRVAESVNIPLDAPAEVVAGLKKARGRVSLEVEVYPSVFESLVLPAWALAPAARELERAQASA